ncbi:MAG: sialate O-acetylesterase [Limisphaerales bacterium]
MKSLYRSVIAVLIFLLFSSDSGTAAVRLPVLFSSNMVLQCDQPVRVWGWAEDDELVVVRYFEQTVSTRAKDGKWSVILEPMSADATGRTLTVTGVNEIQLKNVVVGEVWIASGQSNMAWTLKRTTNWTHVASASSNPNLRLFTVPYIVSHEPLDDIQGEYLGGRPVWRTAGPDSTPEFTAVGYFFGRDLQKARNVPVGIIHTSRGGTPAELWTSHEALAADRGLKAALIDGYDAKMEKYRKDTARYSADAAAAKKAGKKFTRRRPRAPRKSSSLFNSMIHPLLPFSIGGAIWYQGEANASRAHQYRTLLPSMISDWRNGFDQPDLPFFAVELAPYDKRRKRSIEEITRKPVDSDWGELRDAQIHAGRVLENVGTVTITDAGMKDDIHPVNKEPVGARLALLARQTVYGEDIVGDGPSYVSHAVANGQVTVRFRNIGGGLVAKGEKLTGFSIAGRDGQFVWANAEIVDDTVVVSHPNIERPAGVRFGWADFPVVNLWNKDGLPAHPFRTDNFKLTTDR